MPEVLIASMSPIGHLGPLLNLARGLVDRGDRVTVLTSAARAGMVRAAGARPRALPPQTDIDESRLNESLPGREKTSGIKRVDFDITNVFVTPMPHQAAALADAFAETRYDAVIVDAMFLGILPFLLGERAARPPVLAYSTTPLLISSRDTAPPGLGLPPSSSPLGRLRNSALTTLTHRVLLRGCHRAANEALHRMNSRPLPMFVTDAALLADRFIAPTVPEFDYPPQRSAASCALRGRRASRTDADVHPALVVGGARRRTPGGARHPGHRRQRRPPAATAADRRGAGR